MVTTSGKILVQIGSIDHNAIGSKLVATLQEKGYDTFLDFTTDIIPSNLNLFSDIIVVGNQFTNPFYAHLTNEFPTKIRKYKSGDAGNFFSQSANFEGSRIFTAGGWTLNDVSDMADIIIGRYETRTGKIISRIATEAIVDAPGKTQNEINEALLKFIIDTRVKISQETGAKFIIHEIISTPESTRLNYYFSANDPIEFTGQGIIAQVGPIAIIAIFIGISLLIAAASIFILSPWFSVMALEQARLTVNDAQINCNQAEQLAQQQCGQANISFEECEEWKQRARDNCERFIAIANEQSKNMIKVANELAKNPLDKFFQAVLFIGGFGIAGFLLIKFLESKKNDANRKRT